MLKSSSSILAVLEVDGVQRAGMGSGISIKAEADNERLRYY